MIFHWQDILALAGMAALTLRPGSLDGPLEKYEEGVHLSWVQGVLAGKVPYRDYYINYGPLYTLHFVLAHLLLGRSLRTHRLVMAWGNWLSLVAGYALGCVFLEPVWARFALAALLPMLCVDQKYLTCWGGFRMGAGLVGALLFALALAQGGPWGFFGAGLWAGLAFLYSQDETFALVAAAVGWTGLAALGLAPEPAGTSATAAGASYLGGSAVFPLLWLGYTASQGWLRWYLREAVLVVLLMGKWRGGHTVWPQPFAGASSPREYFARLFTEAAHYYAALAWVGLVTVGAVGWASSAGPDAATRSAVWFAAVFGLARLAMAVRVADGPQFKTGLPAFLVLATLCLASGPGWLAWPLALLTACLALSSGYWQFLRNHFRIRMFKPIRWGEYSGVRMPWPIAKMLAAQESALRRLAAPGEEIFCAPYDASPIFFGQTSFVGRHTIGLGAPVFAEDYALLQDELRTKRPLVVLEPDAPDLLPPGLVNRRNLAAVYELLDKEWVEAARVEPEPVDPYIHGRILDMWPGSWFWFDQRDGQARLHPILILQHSSRLGAETREADS